MKNNYIFYHIFLCDKINLIVNDQLNKLINSNLIFNSKLFVLILDNSGLYKLDDVNISIINKYSQEIYYEYNNYYEAITLKKLYDFSLLNSGNYLYMHTKGCTRINDINKSDGYSYKNVENWRNIMEHFTIEHWKLCNDYLEQYDLVGCNYMKKNYLPGVPAHYSGNFWWSTSNYIKKLPDPKLYLTTENRFNSEFWIGRINHKALCLYPLPIKEGDHTLMKNHNRCYFYTPEIEYINNINKKEFYNYE